MERHGPLLRTSSALEQAAERLGHGVVVGVAPASHGGNRAGLGQAFGVADGEGHCCVGRAEAADLPG